MLDEELLAGGNASGSVVRIGATVRKPRTEATPHVHALMDVVRREGVDVPDVHGYDDRGRQVLEYIPGCLALDSDPLTLPELARVGRLVRDIHDASATFRPAPDAHWEVAIPGPGKELICHHDLAPWNLLIGQRWTFIDWDGAGPSTRLWDLAYAAQTFTLNDVARAPGEAARRLVAFVDGYAAGLGIREQLPTAMAQRTEAMYNFLASSHHSGTEPWGSMFTTGHGDHWRAAHGYVEQHQEVWAEALL